MLKIFFKLNINKKMKGFTLLETLTSITILALVIIGPLAIISNSSSFARQTRDYITATYLAEEAIELLQNQYDSIYVYCKKNPTAVNVGEMCEPLVSEVTTGETSWRVFKDRFGPKDSQPSCYYTLNPDGTPGNEDGCSYDFIHMISGATITPVRYVATDNDCKELINVRHQLTSTTTRNMYVCRNEASHISGGVIEGSKYYNRKVVMEHLPTFDSGNPIEHYNDDIRVESYVTFRGINGLSQTVKVVRFMHRRP